MCEGREMASPPAHEPTLLGLCDGELDSRRHVTSFLTNKVGGHPDWLPGISRPAPRCGRCAAPLAHVVQVYCPLEASPYHRNLHLFACPGAACSGRSDGWTVLRSQGPEDRTRSRPSPAQEAPPAATEWWDTADDWGVEEEDGGGGGGVEEDNPGQEETAGPEEKGKALLYMLICSFVYYQNKKPFQGPHVGSSTCSSPHWDTSAGEVDVSSRLQDLNLGVSGEGVSGEDVSGEDVPVLRPFFISVAEESDLCGERDDLRHAQQLLREYERREGAAVGELDAAGGS
ncbi:programmed cell death protein 2-like [Etheostoma spectabile]|uniref:programmed cell death protein 2-like n=1 Tax=Etheostoma spectabile TaxID=54343 RepID=UPI0013AF70FB|nr:programmed cell death protein 2-like [Etheostoma spectabile]